LLLMRRALPDQALFDVVVARQLCALLPVVQTALALPKAAVGQSTSLVETIIGPSPRDQARTARFRQASEEARGYKHYPVSIHYHFHD
jgi:hypothetical protein